MLPFLLTTELKHDVEICDLCLGFSGVKMLQDFEQTTETSWQMLDCADRCNRDLMTDAGFVLADVK